MSWAFQEKEGKKDWREAWARERGKRGSLVMSENTERVGKKSQSNVKSFLSIT